MKGATSIQERLWEHPQGTKSLILEVLSELTWFFPNHALGQYMRMSGIILKSNHGNLITLADFYGECPIDYLTVPAENQGSRSTRQLTGVCFCNDEMVAPTPENCARY